MLLHARDGAVVQLHGCSFVFTVVFETSCSDFCDRFDNNW
jgi:hypothetical protein